jgi:hypothetical protein
MILQNLVFDYLDLESSMFSEAQELEIRNCRIGEIQMTGGTFEERVVISNCVIDGISALGAFFRRGFLLSNCVVSGAVTFEAGGHNSKEHEVRIESNVFLEYVDFFDCYYPGPLYFTGNILVSGSNLLLPNAEFGGPEFVLGLTCENNIGDLEVDPQANM